MGQKKRIFEKVEIVLLDIFSESAFIRDFPNSRTPTRRVTNLRRNVTDLSSSYESKIPNYTSNFPFVNISLSEPP